MASNEYQFFTEWRVPGTIEEVADIIGDAESLPRWWPSVYLDVKILEPGDENGVGREVDLYTKGWLPYTLRWRFRVTESNAPYGFALEAFGDLEGNGAWVLKQEGDIAYVSYDWRVRADKAVLRYLSFILKPIFAANHHWAMARGEESLRLEMQRRRGELPAGARPPQPTFSRWT